MKLNTLSFQLRLLLAIVSGAMIIPLSTLEKFTLPKILGLTIIDISIGVIFALLVMVPFQKPFSWLKSIVMMVASIAIYNTVAQLALNQYSLLLLDLEYRTGIILSGALGALLTGSAVHFLAPLRLTLNTYALLAVLGALTGYIFSISIDSNSVFVNALGYMIWQTTVFLVINFSRK